MIDINEIFNISAKSDFEYHNFHYPRCNYWRAIGANYTKETTGRHHENRGFSFIRSRWGFDAIYPDKIIYADF